MKYLWYVCHRLQSCVLEVVFVLCVLSVLLLVSIPNNKSLIFLYPEQNIFPVDCVFPLFWVTNELIQNSFGEEFPKLFSIYFFRIINLRPDLTPDLYLLFIWKQFFPIYISIKFLFHFITFYWIPSGKRFWFLSQFF